MHNIILCAALLILGSVSASAQFYTITKETEIRPEKKQKVAKVKTREVKSSGGAVRSVRNRKR